MFDYIVLNLSSLSVWWFHLYILFFFFSSRRRHTRYWRDWSSDVCSSDLLFAIGTDYRFSNNVRVGAQLGRRLLRGRLVLETVGGTAVRVDDQREDSADL